MDGKNGFNLQSHHQKKKNTGARCDILAPITPNTYLPQLEMGELFFGIKMIEEAKFVWFIKGL